MKINDFEKKAKSSDRLREALSSRKMKQADLSELTGISKQSINCYVSGKYEPKQEALYKMGLALDVSEMWLAGYDVPKERSEPQKMNDAISGIVHQMLEDEEFLAIVESISKMPPEKRHGLWAFLG